MTSPYRCQKMFNAWMDMVHKKVLYDDAFLWANKTDPSYVHDVEYHYTENVKGDRWVLHFWLHAYKRPGTINPKEITLPEAQVHSFLIEEIRNHSDWPFNYIDGSEEMKPEEGKMATRITGWKYSATRSIELFTLLDDKTKTSKDPLITASDRWELCKAKVSE